MNRHQALAALAETDPIARTPRPVHDVDVAIAALLTSADDGTGGRRDGERFDVVAGLTGPRRSFIATHRGSTLVAGAVLVVVLIAAGLLVAQVNGHHATSPTPTAAATAPTAPTAPTPPFVPDTDGRLAAAVELLGVDLQPPPDDAQPRLSAADATAICRNGTGGCEPGAGPLTTVLASAGTDSDGQIQPDGSIKRTIDHRLVWAITWPSTCMPTGGPPLAPGASPAPVPTPTPCTYLDLVDANSGAPLFLASGSG